MKNIGIFLLLIFPCFIISQDMSQDFGTWTKIKSDFKINKKSITNNVQHIIRFFDSFLWILDASWALSWTHVEAMLATFSFNMWGGWVGRRPTFCWVHVIF